MKGHAFSSTKINIHPNDGNTASGHIHSIVVKQGEEKQENRIRSISPMICMHPDNSIHNDHKGYEDFSKEVSQHPEDISVENIPVENIPVDENHVIPVNVILSNTPPDDNKNIVKSNNPTEIDAKYPGKLKV